MAKNITYEQAYNELLEIVNGIENESISIDILAEKVKRASELIQFCQDKLRSTEKELNNIIKQMDAKDI
ncbi:MAG: exodeoxyribonuclease VII small subunit [bacterium]|jgi:exodeoxyribonuclease VII small subunit